MNRNILEEVKRMNRKDFIKIIKLRSCWKIDRRIGNYELPNGLQLRDYIKHLVESQMQLDNLGIRENGDLCFCSGGSWNPDAKEFDDFTLMPAHESNECCSYDDMEKRINYIVSEIIG